MVGLSIVLEAQKGISQKTPQVINKVTMIKISASPPPPPPSPPPSSRWKSAPALPETGFLDQCFLCKQKLLPGKDIYMYKGDRAFCSVECRCRQIFMDEEEAVKRGNCSLDAMKPPQRTSSPSSSSSSPSRSRRAARNRANAFAF
ncbi:hypothetical protein F0562_000633 [Nyssa sinensis]|uniref:FLZ-type domain-containing protein n=1 Tax=Nyssa sinensis TaxID=561372 RepID=A0A5J5C135_9ASTE|nr:hypothetical protein F0562_000633 [Nyssa sinensis]